MNLITSKVAFLMRLAGLFVSLVIFDFIGDMEHASFSADVLKMYGHGFLGPLILGWGFQVSMIGSFSTIKLPVGDILAIVFRNLSGSVTFYVTIILLFSVFCTLYGYQYSWSVLLLSMANLIFYLIAYAAQSQSMKNVNIFFMFVAPTLSFYVCVVLLYQYQNTLLICGVIMLVAVCALSVLFMCRENKSVSCSLYSYYGGLAPVINIVAIWILPLNLISSMTVSEQTLFMITIRFSSLVNIFTGVVNQASVANISNLVALRRVSDLSSLYSHILRVSLFTSVASFLGLLGTLIVPDMFPITLPHLGNFFVMGLFYIGSVVVGPVGIFMQHSHLSKELSFILLVIVALFLLMSLSSTLDFQTALYTFGCYVLLSNLIAAWYYLARGRSRV